MNFCSSDSTMHLITEPLSCIPLVDYKQKNVNVIYRPLYFGVHTEKIMVCDFLVCSFGIVSNSWLIIIYNTLIYDKKNRTSVQVILSSMLSKLFSVAQRNTNSISWLKINLGINSKENKIRPIW